jgi:3-oxoacyl-[acyl-carrier-protein] synthase-3
MKFSFEAIDYKLGENKLEVSSLFPENIERLVSKTGVRYVFETSSSPLQLAREALDGILQKYSEIKNEISVIIYVTQTPDFELPAHSCILQGEFAFNNNMFVTDIHQGCNGFTQGLSLALKYLRPDSYGLIICADAYRSKLDPADRSTNAVFSDGASVTLISSKPSIEILSQTDTVDGQYWNLLFQKSTGQSEQNHLFMNGREVYSYTRRTVEKEIRSTVAHANLKISDLSFIAPHQASKVVVEGIKQAFDGEAKVLQNVEEFGNTVSSTIPILLRNELNTLNTSVNILCGFGVGLLCTTLLLG